jgi:thiol-disulfide isomerase/thioredoxin
MSSMSVRIWVVPFVAWACAGSSCAGDVPRYAVQPGQVLTYEEDQSFKGSGENSVYRTTWRIWVIGKNDDGSWRMVVRESMKSLEKPGSVSTGDVIATLARIDLYPDGRVPRTPMLGTRFDPAHLFPRMPENEKEVAIGWQAHDDRDDATVRYEPVGGSAKDAGTTFEFVADQSSYMEKIYEGKDKRTFRFDRTKGLVTGATIERAFGSHINSKGAGTLELKAIDTMDSAKLARFRDEMNLAFETIEAYRRAYRGSPKAGRAAEPVLKAARGLLTDARAKVTLPEAIAAIDDQLKNHDRFLTSQIDEAERLAKVIGQPAAPWEVKDLNGKTHTLEQYRGKVLVLDFWYRGCGWCMRAMPQVKKVAEHYKGQPVAVFGMNNDRKLDDAKFVVEKMALEYPVLRSDELPAKYAVSGFPTLIVVDQEGKVADVHIGYSDHLFEAVTATVDRLLKSPVTPASGHPAAVAR